MANYDTLKAAIADVIKTNGNNAITGALLQQELIAMIESLGAGYQFMGLATPSTVPGTPDQRVFYVGFSGTYSNFGETITVADDSLVVFLYSSSWSNVVVPFMASALRFYPKDFRFFQLYGTDNSDRVIVQNVKESDIFRSFLMLKLFGFEADGIYMISVVRRNRTVPAYRFIFDKYDTAENEWERYADFEILEDIEIVRGGVNVFDKTLPDGKRMFAVIDFSYYGDTNVGAILETPPHFIVSQNAVFPYGDYAFVNSENGRILRYGDLEITIMSNNIANPLDVVLNKLVASDGLIKDLSGWAYIHIPVSPGDVITMGGFTLGRMGYYAFYNGASLVSYDRFADPQGTTNPITFTIPSGVDTLCVDILTSVTGSNYDNLQANYGDELKDYDVYKRGITKIDGWPLAGTGGDGGGGDLTTLIVDLPVSDGTEIASGYAYIDITDRSVKVKA